MISPWRSVIPLGVSFISVFDERRALQIFRKRSTLPWTWEGTLIDRPRHSVRLCEHGSLGALEMEMGVGVLGYIQREGVDLRMPAWPKATTGYIVCVPTALDLHDSGLDSKQGVRYIRHIFIGISSAVAATQQALSKLNTARLRRH